MTAAPNIDPREGVIYDFVLKHFGHHIAQNQMIDFLEAIDAAAWRTDWENAPIDGETQVDLWARSGARFAGCIYNVVQKEWFVPGHLGLCPTRCFTHWRIVPPAPPKGE